MLIDNNVVDTEWFRIVYVLSPPMTYGSAIPTGVSVCIGSEVFNLVEKKGTNIKTSCACRALGAGAPTVLPVELENWEPEKKYINE